MSSTGNISASVFGSQKAADSAFERKSTFGGPFHIQDGSILVRFLTEMDSWVEYKEVYDAEARKYRTLWKGEVPADPPTRRILASALWKDADGDTVVALRLPWSLGTTMKEKYKRLGTITDRDYVLTKSGAGLETRYDVDSEPPTPCDLKSYIIQPLMEVLEEHNGLPKDSAAGGTPLRNTRPERVAKATGEEDLDLGLDEAITEDKPSDELTMEDLTKSSVADLKKLAASLGLQLPAGGSLTKGGLVDLIWEVMHEPF